MTKITLPDWLLPEVELYRSDVFREARHCTPASRESEK